jgi:dTDP-4-dehydrorhamnose reductase
MLGTEVLRQLAPRPDTIAIPATSQDMDLTDAETVRQFLHTQRPTHIIHCAAYTLVDQAEKEPARAWQINGTGTRNLALHCQEIDAELLYVSTDYVFDGRKRTPYLETDPTGPLNIYGASKLLGETYTATILPRHKIIRTSWLNGLGGNSQRNFIETMLRLSQTRDTLSLVSDQQGRPTFTTDLAATVIALLSIPATGIFHVANSGSCTWFDFAQEVFRQTKRSITLHPILTEQYPTPAQRPAYSVMAETRLEQLGIPPLPAWQDALARYLALRSEP